MALRSVSLCITRLVVFAAGSGYYYRLSRLSGQYECNDYYQYYEQEEVLVPLHLVCHGLNAHFQVPDALSFARVLHECDHRAGSCIVFGYISRECLSLCGVVVYQQLFVVFELLIRLQGIGVWRAVAYAV